MLTFRVARLAGLLVDGVLTGRYPPLGVCAHVGDTAEWRQVAVSLSESSACPSLTRSRMAKVISSCVYRKTAYPNGPSGTKIRTPSCLV